MRIEMKLQHMAEAVREWPQRVKDAGVKLDNGTAYHPVARNIAVLDHVDDPYRLYAYAKETINAPIDRFEQGTAGWDRIVVQAGVELTWEWIVVDPDAPWADLFSGAERQRVVAAGRATRERADRRGLTLERAA